MDTPAKLHQNSLLLRLGSLPKSTILSQLELLAIVESIDSEIERLQRARALLNGHRTPLKSSTANETLERRKMSGEGRARIALAQKNRWEKKK
jgi:hypothetical protein